MTILPACLMLEWTHSHCLLVSQWRHVSLYLSATLNRDDSLDMTVSTKVTEGGLSAHYMAIKAVEGSSPEALPLIPALLLLAPPLHICQFTHV